MIDTVGFWRRFFAAFLDGIVISLPLFILGLIVSGEWDSETIQSFVQIVYSIFLPVFWYGYTVGKKMMGIRVVRVDGKKLGIGTMLLRVIVTGIVYGITFGIGVIVSAFMVGIRKDHRAIHDFIAGTYVTSDRP